MFKHAPCCVYFQIWLQVSEGQSSSDFDEQVLDKCLLLQSQVFAPSDVRLLLGNTTFDDSLLLQSQPLSLKFGSTPPFSPRNARSGPQLDSVHLTSLSASKKHRVCIRCDSVSAVGLEVMSYILGQWQGTWQRNCACGGLWISM